MGSKLSRNITVSCSGPFQEQLSPPPDSSFSPKMLKTRSDFQSPGASRGQFDGHNDSVSNFAQLAVSTGVCAVVVVCRTWSHRPAEIGAARAFDRVQTESLGSLQGGSSHQQVLLSLL